MFVAGASGPVVSGMGASAAAATNELVLLASKAVSDWKKPHVEALSRSFVRQLRPLGPVRACGPQPSTASWRSAGGSARALRSRQS